MTSPSKKLIVQKFGGNTVSTPDQIKAVAEKISRLKKQGHQVIAVVSAMGDTTDDLITLAHKISLKPQKREFDMLISAGERISIALLSIALHEIGCDCISFTGSQAGVLTDQSYSQARIIDIKPIRVESELANNRVIVLAGFQGVNPVSKDVTTLGRGGTDTTAVAMAAHLNASVCEILKDVDGVMSGDPRVIPKARLIPELSFDECISLTFWGAQFLHTRAAHLAKSKSVSLSIKSAHNESSGTQIQHEVPMYEKSQVISVTNHKMVREISFKTKSASKALQNLSLFSDQNNITQPQIVHLESSDSGTNVFVTHPDEAIKVLDSAISSFPEVSGVKSWSTVTAIVRGGINFDLQQKLISSLGDKKIEIKKLFLQPDGISFLIVPEKATEALQVLHSSIES